MKSFDITCTATLRPELLYETFNTHIKYLFKDNIKKANLIINVDTVGCIKEKEGEKIKEIIRVINSFPFKETIFNFSPKPSFSKAFVWCFKQVKSEFVFNLEEDWKMEIEIDFEEMMNQFVLNERLVHLRLSAFNSDNFKLKNWNKWLNWNGSFFEVPKEISGTIGWCGHPSLNRSSFMKYCVENIDENKNPEKQIKHNNPALKEVINNSVFGCFHPRKTNKAIHDTGRFWMVKNGWVKKGSKAFFTEWEQVQQ